MENKENSFVLNNQQVNVSPSVRPSLFQTLEAVYMQVEYEHLGEWRESRVSGKKWLHIEPIYKELCLIIAEIYVKPQESVIRIQGQPTEVYLVQEVYRELRGEHLQAVVGKFFEQGHKIHNKKAYLQTSLYNIVFEYDAGVTNDLRAAGVIHPKKPKGGA